MSSGVNAVHAQYKPSFLNVAIINAMSKEGSATQDLDNSGM